MPPLYQYFCLANAVDNANMLDVHTIIFNLKHVHLLLVVK